MKTLVTGAGGFLAGEIVKKLAERGEYVKAMYRSSYDKSFDDSEFIEPVKADLLDKESLRKAIEGCDKIYHVAAFSSNWAKNPTIFYRVNIGGAINLFDLAKELGVKKIVVTSSAGTLGPAQSHDADSFASEDHFRTINFFGDYESSKFIVDERAQAYVRDGLDISIVCPTRIFGPGKKDSRGNMIAGIVEKYMNGKWHWKLGNGKDQACYAFIEDVVQGHLLTMEKGRPGEKYLIGSFNATFIGFLNTVGEITGKKRKLISIPFSVLSFLSFTLGALSKIFKFDPLLTPEWMVKLQMNWFADTSKAQKELGFKPHTQREALEKTINWLKK